MDSGFDIGLPGGKPKERRMMFPVVVTREPDGTTDMIQRPDAVPNGVLLLFGAPRALDESRDSVLDRTMMCVDPLVVN